MALLPIVRRPIARDFATKTYLALAQAYDDLFLASVLLPEEFQNDKALSEDVQVRLSKMDKLLIKMENSLGRYGTSDGPWSFTCLKQ